MNKSIFLVVILFIIISCDFGAESWLVSEKQYEYVDNRVVNFSELIGTYAVTDTAIRRQFKLKDNQLLSLSLQ